MAEVPAHREVRHQPADLRGRDRPDVHPHAELGQRPVSQAHDLDARLEPIIGKSREGFVFTIDLQVQIHVSDTRAPKVISMVGTMLNLVNEVLQSAVGNHFRNTLQELEAVRFIETRQEVQQAALDAVTRYLSAYQVETRGVYIQDVVFPAELVEVLTRREIARQEQTTFQEQQRAETARIEIEKAKGTADMQAELAAAQVSVGHQPQPGRGPRGPGRGRGRLRAPHRPRRSRPDQAIGLAEAQATEALGLARAAGFDAQAEAIGQAPTALVAVTNAVADGHVDVMPDVLVTGGGSSLDGLAATLMRHLTANGTRAAPPAPSSPATTPRSPSPNPHPHPSPTRPDRPRLAGVHATRPAARHATPSVSPTRNLSPLDPEPSGDNRRGRVEEWM